MKIGKIDINLLKLAKYNPRKDLQPEDIEYQKIKRSLEEFGYVDPVIINKDMTVIGGNQRVKVLKELGYKKVDCVLLNINKTKEKALNIALNKIQGEWDLPKLKDLLLELDTGEFDIEITGFDYSELEELMTQFFVPDESEKDDEVPDIPEEPISKLGDLYKLGEHRLLCGDATKIEDVKRLMDGNKADMVFTDPPYGVGEEKWDKFNETSLKEFTKKWLSNINANTYLTFFDSDYLHQIIGWFKDLNLPYCQTLIWHYRNIVGLSLGYAKPRKIGFTKTYQPIILATNLERQRLKNLNEFDTFDVIVESTLQSNFKEADNKGSRFHKYQKPLKVLLKCLLFCSKSNDIIVDLFGGSGSTLIACEKINRKCYMMEIDNQYVDVIIKRYENYTGNKAKLIENRKETIGGRRKKKMEKV